MGLDLISKRLHAKYTFEERDHACAILKTDFPQEFKDILDCLDAFTLKKSEMLGAQDARYQDRIGKSCG